VRATTALAAVCMWLVGATPHLVVAQDIRSGVDQLASQIEQGAKPGKQLRLAVADFPNLQGVTCELGRFISSRLTTRLAQSPKFVLLERQRLGQLLSELKFSMTDLADPSKAKQLGRMAGVDAMVVGALTDLGNKVEIDARLTEIDTTTMLFAASISVVKDVTVAAMLERGCAGAVASVPGEGSSVNAVSRDGYLFQPVGCRLGEPKFMAPALVCTVRITNTHSTERSVTFYLGSCGPPSTALVDNGGNTYPLSSAGTVGTENCQKTIRLPSQLPVNLEFYPWGIPAERFSGATHFNVLLGIRGYRDTLVLRDLKMVR